MRANHFFEVVFSLQTFANGSLHDHRGKYDMDLACQLTACCLVLCWRSNCVACFTVCVWFCDLLLLFLCHFCATDRIRLDLFERF